MALSTFLPTSPIEIKALEIGETQKNSLAKEFDKFRKNFGSANNSFEKDIFIPEVDDEIYSPANFRARRPLEVSTESTTKKMETEGDQESIVEMMNNALKKKKVHL